MKSTAKFLASAVLMFCAALVHAGGFEALKSGSWAPDAAAVRAQPGPGAFSPGRPVADRPGDGQFRSYGRRGYTFESDARAALQEAESNLRAAGVAVVATRVYKDDFFPWRYGWVMNYASNTWSLSLQTFTSGAFKFESDAKAEMERTKASLRASGFVVVVGQTIKGENFPWDYTYQVVGSPGTELEFAL